MKEIKRSDKLALVHSDIRGPVFQEALRIINDEQRYNKALGK